MSSTDAQFFRLWNTIKIGYLSNNFFFIDLLCETFGLSIVAKIIFRDIVTCIFGNQYFRLFFFSSYRQYVEYNFVYFTRYIYRAIIAIRALRKILRAITMFTKFLFFCLYKTKNPSFTIGQEHSTNRNVW